jgi:hypothetical protein
LNESTHPGRKIASTAAWRRKGGKKGEKGGEKGKKGREKGRKIEEGSVDGIV